MPVQALRLTRQSMSSCTDRELEVKLSLILGWDSTSELS